MQICSACSVDLKGILLFSSKLVSEVEIKTEEKIVKSSDYRENLFQMCREEFTLLPRVKQEMQWAVPCTGLPNFFLRQKNKAQMAWKELICSKGMAL
jgi:hypothetical protein